MKKTCFVIIGYGIKTDYATGREIDLDKTYRTIIEPAFNELDFLCFRASDIQHSGMIDIPMYENILKADFVIADLTTLNPNVLYELGIRHAVRKNTTMVISDKDLKYPFDLSHIVIDSYEHLGKAIDYEEVLRFKNLLKEKISQLLANPITDSPIYSLFPHLNVPSFTEQEIKDLQADKNSEQSISDLLNEAESAKNSSDFTKAIELLEKASKFTPANHFIIQRLALATYKSKKPTPKEALEKAKTILTSLNPEVTTDIETLGLSGAINKRLFELENKIEFLNKALWFYERGYYISNDYYNGINAAYLHTIKSTLENDKFEAYSHYGQANIIRKKVIEICNEIIESKIWADRDDKQWVYFSLAEAFLGIGDINNVEITIGKAMEEIKGDFSVKSFLEQQQKLTDVIELFKSRNL